MPQPSDALPPSKPGFLAMPAVHPLEPDGAGTYAWIPVKTANRLANHGPSRLFHELLTLVRWTVAEPDLILRLSGDESAWCYARRETRACEADGGLVQASPDLLFVVFLSGRLVIQRWRWSPCDPRDRALPLDDQARQGRVTWRKTK
jgi:hypothetical protein